MAETQRPLAQFSDLLQGKASLAGEQVMRGYESAYAEPKISSKDAFMAGLIGLAPLIVGMIKGGKKGAYGGAMGGLAGVQAFNTVLSDEYKDKKEKGLLQAKQASEQQQAFQSQALKAQQSDLSKQQDFTDDVRLKEMSPDKGIVVNVNNLPENKPWSDNERQSVSSGMDIVRLSSNTLNRLDEIAMRAIQKGEGDPRTKGYVDDKGNVLTENVWNNVGEWAKGKVVKGGTTFTDMQNEVKQFVKPYQKLLSGLQSTDKEYDKILSIIEGEGGITPANMKVVRENLIKLQNQAKSAWRMAEEMNQIGRMQGASRMSALEALENKSLKAFSNPDIVRQMSSGEVEKDSAQVEMSASPKFTSPSKPPQPTKLPPQGAAKMLFSNGAWRWADADDVVIADVQ